jgi:hypothetical protein
MMNDGEEEEAEAEAEAVEEEAAEVEEILSGDTTRRGIEMKRFTS